MRCLEIKDCLRKCSRPNLVQDSFVGGMLVFEPEVLVRFQERMSHSVEKNLYSYDLFISQYDLCGRNHI